MVAVAEVARREVARREAAEAVQCEAAEAVQFEAAEAVEAAAAAAAAEAAGPAGFGRLWAGSLSANNGRTQGDENTIILDVRFGSKADMAASHLDVRCYSNSGHVQRTSRCPLCANSGHSHRFGPRRCYSMTSSAIEKTLGGNAGTFSTFPNTHGLL